MKKRLLAFLLCMVFSLFVAGCSSEDVLNRLETLTTPTDSTAEIVTEPESEIQTESEPETESQTFSAPENEPLPESVEKDGSYTSPEDVAAYIHTFGTLPGNFITKKEAQKLGWDNHLGNLQEVAPGKSIGGDNFGNREGLLPDGTYHECDVNYQGGYRGAERLIYSDTGEIYYTNDHYQTFTQLY